MAKTLLVVDDSRTSRALISSIVKEYFPDWQVVEAASAEEALAHSETGAFDCATIDFNMPGMDGLELGTLLQRKYPKTRYSLLTANIQDAIHKKATAAGMEFIPKPISVDKIMSFVNAVDK